MDASRVLVPVASIKPPAQSLPLALCARPELVCRLDLATQSSTERTREQETRAKKSNFVNGASSVQSCQSCQPLTRLIWLSSSDRLRSYLRLPGSGHEATRLSPVSGVRQHDTANRSPLNPWIPRNVVPPLCRTETRPFFLAGCCFLNGTPCTIRPKSASPSCGASSSFQTLLLP